MVLRLYYSRNNICVSNETAGLFTQDQAVIDLFNEMSLFLVILQFLNGFTFSLDGLGKGLGQGKHLRNSLLLSTILGFLPLLFILQRLDYHLSSIWLPFLLWMLLRGGILYISPHCKASFFRKITLMNSLSNGYISPKT